MCRGEHDADHMLQSLLMFAFSQNCPSKSLKGVVVAIILLLQTSYLYANFGACIKSRTSVTSWPYLQRQNLLSFFLGVGGRLMIIKLCSIGQDKLFHMRWSALSGLELCSKEKYGLKRRLKGFKFLALNSSANSKLD